MANVDTLHARQISRAIRVISSIRGISRAELAGMMNISMRTMENKLGRGTMNMREFLAIADVLGFRIKLVSAECGNWEYTMNPENDN